MVDWMDPKEILKDSGTFTMARMTRLLRLLSSEIFLKMIYVLFGAYVWELFTTCGFEWSLITGRKRFRWPLVRPPTDLIMTRPDILTRVWVSLLELPLVEINDALQSCFSCVDIVCFSRSSGCKYAITATILVSDSSRRIIAYSTKSKVRTFELMPLTTAPDQRHHLQSD
jgi:hypothetical protein